MAKSRGRKLAELIRGGSDVASGSIGTSEIASDAITAAKIAAGAVGTTDLADDAVTQAKVAAGAIGTTELGSAAVTEAKIDSGAVTNAKIASGVDASKLTTGTLPAARIGAGSITVTKIADGAVTAAKIAAGAAVPTQTGQSGKYLTTDGTDASWATITDPTPTVVSDQANTSTGYFDVPAGTTAQRPASPATGMIRYNTTISLMEYYDGATWKPIDAPPVITGISPTSIADTAGATNFTISGQGFASGATVTAIASNNTTVNASVVTVNNSSSITATFSGSSFSNSLENYSIKVTNNSGLSNTLNECLTVNGSPSWSTASGTIADISDIASGNHVTVAASDPEGSTITYGVASGSLPGGLSISSSGVISGNPTDVSADTTTTFSLSASDGVNSVNRSFNIIVRKTNDGTTSARAGASASAIKSATGTTTNGFYWITTPSDNVARQWYCDMNTDGGGYVLIARTSNYLTSNPGNWYDSNNAGGFSTSSSGIYRGGGYFNNNSQNYIMFEVQAGSSATVRKARLYWNGYNFNTIPARTFNSFSHNVSNAPHFASNYNGWTSSVRGQNYFSEQFCIAFSGRGAGGNMDKGEWGAYFFLGSHYNGSHQHHEESLPNNDSDGTGAILYGGDWKYSNWGGSGGLGEGNYGGYVNIWAKV